MNTATFEIEVARFAQKRFKVQFGFLHTRSGEVRLQECPSRCIVEPLLQCAFGRCRSCRQT